MVCLKHPWKSTFCLRAESDFPEVFVFDHGKYTDTSNPYLPRFLYLSFFHFCFSPQALPNLCGNEQYSSCLFERIF